MATEDTIARWSQLVTGGHALDQLRIERKSQPVGKRTRGRTKKNLKKYKFEQHFAGEQARGR